jgi:TolA-binding protein
MARAAMIHRRRKGASDAMTTIVQTLSRRVGGAVLAGAVLAAAPLPALAQDRVDETRIRKIEAEVRALQRKVFPGGDARFFEPEIQPGKDPAPATTLPAPSTSALTDVLVRLDGLELQMQQLTARSEEQANALSQLEQRLAALEAGGAAGGLAAGQTGYVPPPPIDRSATAANATATSGNLAAMTSTAPAATAAARPDATRLAAVQAIAKPQTDDAGDDEYSYGFRLWNAGFLPEARQQLNSFVEKYPRHRRISFGRNLLGRAYLDDGMPEEAARWFLRNYQADKNGDRAPDSLLYLGASMIAMKDTKRACIALAEFGETYPAIATGRLAAEYQANRAKVKCN